MGRYLRSPNVAVALRHLKSLQKKIVEDPELAKAYTVVINKYLAKGCTRKVLPEELGGMQYFQPHFAVIKPSDPSKVRVVFDAAAL